MPEYVCVSTHPQHLADGREVTPEDTVELPSKLEDHDADLVNSGRLQRVQAKPKPQSRRTKKETTP